MRHAVRNASFLVTTLLFFLFGTTALMAQSADRLSDDAVPIGYTLDLTIDPDKDAFSGAVAIEIDLKKATDTITLHGEGLTAEQASVTLGDGQTVAASYKEHPVTGQAWLSVEQSIQPGKVTLHLTYSAALTDSLIGLYRSTYGGKTYAYSQMQAIFARRAFPAFDEPRFKTPFTISITHRDAHIAVSNAPETSKTPEPNGLVRTQFAATQPLPTYLIAFAVGDFDVVEWEPLPPTDRRDRAIALRGITPKGDGDKIKHALEITQPLFELLEDWFDLPYPYAKLDLIAAHDFRSWGMENVGAIIYRADKILLPEDSSVYQKRTIASLHAHELAHSWFGNYVTPLWWDDIWLNESFATWLANRIIHLWKPEEYADYRPIEGAAGAMWDDRLASARSIRQPIVTDGDISHAFNSASYTKGNGVIAMAENYLGATAFREAVRDHIKAHPHGVASTADFMQALAARTGDTGIGTAMSSFLDQPGVAFVTVKQICKQDGPPHVTFSQSRYLPLGSTGESARQWEIPLCLAYGRNGRRERFCHLMNGERDSLSLPDGPCPNWLMPNGGGAAYMIFDMESDGWDRLVSNFDKLTVAEKISTAASVQTAYLAGKIDTERLFQFVDLFAATEEWAVSRRAMQMLRTVAYGILPPEKRALVARRAREAYAGMRENFDTSIASFARADSDPVKAKQRSDLFWFLALDAQDESLHSRLAEAGRRYVGYDSWLGAISKDWAMNWDALHPNFVWLGLIAALEETGLPYAEHLIGLLSQDFNRAMHNSLLAALGNSTDPAVVKRVRQYVLAPDTLAGDAEFLLGRQSRRADNGETMRAWIFEHYDRLLEILPTSSHPWIVWHTANSCSTDARDEVEEFFKPRIEGLTGAQRALANVLENISLCAALRKAQRPGALAALER